VEFSSRFRDQDTECIVTRHCTWYYCLRRLRSVENSASPRVLRSSLKTENLLHTKRPVGNGSAANASFMNFSVLSLTKLTSWPEQVTPS
jgi:hypothetical protein